MDKNLRSSDIASIDMVTTCSVVLSACGTMKVKCS